jgi:hypothetical protein
VNFEKIAMYAKTNVLSTTVIFFKEIPSFRYLVPTLMGTYTLYFS